MTGYSKDLVERFNAAMKAAGLQAAGSEREEMLEAYAEVRVAVEAMYLLPEARDETPALGFSAVPPNSGWHSARSSGEEATGKG